MLVTSIPQFVSLANIAPISLPNPCLFILSLCKPLVQYCRLYADGHRVSHCDVGNIPMADSQTKRSGSASSHQLPLSPQLRQAVGAPLLSILKTLTLWILCSFCAGNQKLPSDFMFNSHVMDRG